MDTPKPDKPKFKWKESELVKGLLDALSGKRTTPIDYGYPADPMPEAATGKEILAVVLGTLLFFLVVFKVGSMNPTHLTTTETTTDCLGTAR